MAPPRLLFLCPAIGQPRYHRRAKDLMPHFEETHALCFQRGFYRENPWPSGVKQVLLPRVESKRHFERIKLMPRTLMTIRNQVRESRGPVCIYAFGLDCGLYATLACRPGDLVIWEVSDLLTPFIPSKFKAALVKLLEKWVLKRCHYLVTVCQGMFDDYFAHLQASALNKLIVIENRLTDEHKSTAGPTKISARSPIKLGWSGALRSGTHYQRLIDAVIADQGRTVTLDIWGAGEAAELASEAAKSPFINYWGPFKETPDELRGIHQLMDVQVVLEDSTNLNFRFAFPNRWSHSLVYQTPLIVYKNSDMGNRVEELSIGMMVDEVGEDWPRLFQKLAEPNLIQSWLNNLTTIPNDLKFIDSRPLLNKISAWRREQT